MYHVRLKKTGENRFTGTWKPLMVERLQSPSIFLSVEKNEDGTFAAYPFFGDQRFSGTWSVDFRQQGDVVYFGDFKTGMKFRGRLLKDKILLDILFNDLVIATSYLLRSKTDWEFGTTNIAHNQSVDTPPQLNDGWITANIHDYGIKQAPLVRMINSINAKKFENTHSVLIAKGNRLVFEAYFEGYNAYIPQVYVVENKKIESIEARGAGGQYTFVIPELESVVVITSGNFRNGRLLQQPEKILEEYILPAIMD